MNIPFFISFIIYHFTIRTLSDSNYHDAHQQPVDAFKHIYNEVLASTIKRIWTDRYPKSIICRKSLGFGPNQFKTLYGIPVKDRISNHSPISQ